MPIDLSDDRSGAVFQNRVDAGSALARKLDRFRGTDAVVLGLPRGGVPVAAVVAEALGLPLDVIIVRKLGIPRQPEVAMGAIGEGGARVLNRNIISLAGITDSAVAAVEEAERRELESRVRTLRKGRSRIDFAGRIAIIVDDGVATGSTAQVACRIARDLGARRVVLAVPVMPAEAPDTIPDADEIVCVRSADAFLAVGFYYSDFSPTGEDEVIRLLDQSSRRTGTLGAGAHRAGSRGTGAQGTGAQGVGTSEEGNAVTQ